MASKWYPAGVHMIFDAALDWEATDKFKCALYTGSYTNTHDAYDDVSASVIETPKLLNDINWSVVSTTTLKYDATDPATWSTVAAGSTITGVIIYYDSGTPSTSYLVAFLDCTDTPTNGGDITIAFHTNGIGTIDMA